MPRPLELEKLNSITNDKGEINLNIDLSFDVSLNEDDDLVLGGWFTTEKLNSYDMIVKADGLTLKDFDGQAFFMHDKFTFPVGKAIKSSIKAKPVPGKKYLGTWGEVIVFAEAHPLLKRGIREKVLNGFSVGFKTLKHEYDKENDILTITKWALGEISIVTKGANDEARFEVLHALDEDIKNNGYEEGLIELNDILISKKRKGSNMPGLTESQLADLVNVDDFTQLKADHAKTMDELQALKVEIATKQQELNDGMISKNEFKLRLDKMSEDFEGLVEKIQTVQNIAKVEENRFAFDDYRSMISNFTWLTDEATGKPMSEIHQKAYGLFQLPVDYKAMKNGLELKNLRNLHDAVLFVDSVMRFKTNQRGGAYNLFNLPLYKELQTQVERFDPDIALAMSTASTGYGAEWVPQEMSAEFNELLRKMPALSNYFQTWMMPRGGSAYFPFQNGRATVYKGSQATVPNPSEARKTNVATGQKLFTPQVFIGALVSSAELDEDSIVNMVQFIRSELATALLEGMESALINGDDTPAAHFDNSGSTDAYESYEVETCFKGLRKLGVTAGGINVETLAGTTGINSLDIDGIVNNKTQMGVAGLRSDECVHITGIKGKGQFLNALYEAGVYGTVNTITTGVLPEVDGAPVYVSAYFPENLESNGVFDSGTDVAHTGFLTVHTPSFRIGQRRGITLEFNKNILTQQQQFVGTARWDFGKISADEIIPVKYSINVQHT